MKKIFCKFFSKSLGKRLDESNLSKSEISSAKECLKKDFPFGIESCGSDALRFALSSYNFYGEYKIFIIQEMFKENFFLKVYKMIKLKQSLT